MSMLPNLHLWQWLPEEKEDLWHPQRVTCCLLPLSPAGTEGLCPVPVFTGHLQSTSYALQHPHQLSLLLHQSSSEETARLEARRWRGKVGREGSRLLSEEAKEEERSHGWAGEGSQLSRAAQQMCYDSSILGRAAAGVPPQGFASRYLLPSVALAWSAISPWAEAPGMLWVPIWLQAERGVH